MTKMIRNWRYRALVRQLKSLSARELRALGIRPAEIDRLAFAAAYA